MAVLFERGPGFRPGRCDAVREPGTPSACSPQLLLSFSATTVRLQASACSSWLCNYPSIRGFGALTKTVFASLTFNLLAE